MRLVTIVTNKADGPTDPRPRFQGGLNWSSEKVLENRRRILSPYGIENNFVRMSPKHGDEIAVVDEGSFQKWSGKLLAGRPEVDAMITNLPNVGLECSPADCGVYAIFHEEVGWLAMVHAGRFGSIKKILNKTLKEMARLAEVDLKVFIGGLKVWMAPAICGEHYRKEYLMVPQEDLDSWGNFILGDYEVEDENGMCKIKAKNGLIGIDFVGFNREQLLNNGLGPEQLDFSDVCTFESDDHPSSYQDALTEEIQSRFMVMVMMSE